MDVRRLQKFFAYCALLFLPWPCFRPFESSLTFGDIFLALAAALNADQLFRIRPFQIPLILSFPFMVTSQLFDSDAGIVEVAQALYIFGFVIPFGHTAFSNISFRRCLYIFLFAQCLSSAVAVTQMMGILGPVGKQLLWATRDSTRSAGLSVTCSGLCMNLTSLFCFLKFIPTYRHRICVLLLLCLGIIATLAKSTIFAIPAVIYFLATEPKRNRVLMYLGATAGIILVFVAFSSGAQEKIAAVSESVLYRAEHLEYSIYERMSTLRFALQSMTGCLIIGLGYNGTSAVVSQHLGNTVHVYHVGLVLIGGMICAVLHYWGYVLMLREAASLKQNAIIFAVVSHWLSVCTMTVLMHSFQYTPLLMCGILLQATVAGYERQEAAASEVATRRLVPARLSTAAVPVAGL